MSLRTIDRPRHTTSSPGASGATQWSGEVGFVHDARHVPQHRVLECVAAQDGLEAAVAAVVRQFDPSHVEGRHVAWYLVGVVDEHEFGVGIDESPDQPRACCPVDVDPGPGGPPHQSTRSMSAASLNTAACALSRSGGGKKSRRPIRCSSRCRRPRVRRSTPSCPAATPASSITARYSSAIAEAIRDARRRSSLADPGRPTHTVASPPASSTSSAIHSNCSFVRASEGNATSPSTGCATPSRRSFRHTAILGVEGSLGMRYANSTQSGRADTLGSYCNHGCTTRTGVEQQPGESREEHLWQTRSACGGHRVRCDPGVEVVDLARRSAGPGASEATSLSCSTPVRSPPAKAAALRGLAGRVRAHPVTVNLRPGSKVGVGQRGANMIAPRIGTILGTSAQAAQQRYAAVVEAS